VAILPTLTVDNRMWSSHSCDGSKLYFSFQAWRGGLSNVHIPSSANAEEEMRQRIKINEMRFFIKIILPQRRKGCAAIRRGKTEKKGAKEK
jgi:hypothetical protein